METAKQSAMTEIFGEMIDSYSRAQALEDGVLVDVSETAREAGIKYPVALTREVWGRYVEVPQGVNCQDVRGRLWDILFIYVCAIKAHRITGDRGFYRLYVRNHNRARMDRRDLVELKAICGPGDDPKPVITIMLPEED